MVIALVAVGPSLFLLLYFYLADRYEPEPRGHVRLAFGLGMVAMGAAVLGDLGIAATIGPEWLALGGLPARAFEAFVMAGVVEEGAKWLLFVLVVYRWAEFDEPLDGVVYGVALSLGFATVENVLYVGREGVEVGLLRAVFAVPAHALLGATMGGFLGRAKLGGGKEEGRDVTTRERRDRIGLALAIPILVHGLYDLLLLELVGAAMYGAVGAGSVALWIFILRRVHHAKEDSPFKPDP